MNQYTYGERLGNKSSALSERRGCDFKHQLVMNLQATAALGVQIVCTKLRHDILHRRFDKV